MCLLSLTVAHGHRLMEVDREAQDVLGVPRSFNLLWGQGGSLQFGQKAIPFRHYLEGLPGSPGAVCLPEGREGTGSFRTVFCTKLCS